MPELKPRANTLVQLADSAAFLFAGRPLSLDEGAAAQLTPEARSLLGAAHRQLVALANWDSPSLEAAIREVAEANGVKLGKLAQPLRAALTGRTTSPGIFDVLALLGRDESLARIADQMEPKE
jgi:glutamyl-tRNA synthetase